MKVPLLDLKRQNAPIERELVDAFERVLRSGQYILGKEVEESLAHPPTVQPKLVLWA